MKQRTKHIITLFFLIVFLSVKFSNLHAISHIKDGEHGKVEHCDVCKFTLSQDMTPALLADVVTFVPIVAQMETHTVSSWKTITYNRLSSITLYNKPPPFIS